MVGSLTGAVSSKRVTEEREGTLSAVGNRASRAKAQGCLTARQTRRAGTKVGLSDPVVLYGRAIAITLKQFYMTSNVKNISFFEFEEIAPGTSFGYITFKFQRL
jgi:hypothetical protein